MPMYVTEKICFSITLREATKKKTGKKVHNSCELWGSKQILVCEPQKSAFFSANFPKKHAEINS